MERLEDGSRVFAFYVCGFESKEFKPVKIVLGPDELERFTYPGEARRVTEERIMDHVKERIRVHLEYFYGPKGLDVSKVKNDGYYAYLSNSAINAKDEKKLSIVINEIENDQST